MIPQEQGKMKEGERGEGEVKGKGNYLIVKA